MIQTTSVVANPQTKDPTNGPQAADGRTANDSRTAHNSRTAEKSLGMNLDKHFVGLYQRLLALRNDSARPGQVIGVTSAQPGEGVSTVAAGLAACAAQLGGAPALLVDANLARPSTTRIFQLGSHPGLFEVLMGTMAPGDCIRPSHCEGLSLMTSGCWTSGIEPAYVPTAIAALIAELRSSFSTIVVDLPAAEECSPASVIGRALDGVLLIVESGRSQDEIVRRAALRLQRANVVVLGVVLNKRK